MVLCELQLFHKPSSIAASSEPQTSQFKNFAQWGGAPEQNFTASEACRERAYFYAGNLWKLPRKRRLEGTFFLKMKHEFPEGKQQKLRGKAPEPGSGAAEQKFWPAAQPFFSYFVLLAMFRDLTKAGQEKTQKKPVGHFGFCFGGFLRFKVFFWGGPKGILSAPRGRGKEWKEAMNHGSRLFKQSLLYRLMSSFQAGPSMQAPHGSRKRGTTFSSPVMRNPWAV